MPHFVLKYTGIEDKRSDGEVSVSHTFKESVRLV